MAAAHPFGVFVGYRLKRIGCVSRIKVNAEVEGENIFEPTVANESLHQDSNDNGIRIVNIATSKNLVIDHILMDRRWHSSIVGCMIFQRS